MDYKDNINYYKKNENMKFLGAGMLIVGLFLLWLAWDFWVYIIATVLVPVGLVMFIIFSGGRASESDIDEYVVRKCEGLEVYLAEDNKYRRRIIEHIEPRNVEGYSFRDGVMLKKAKDSSVRSSEYTKSIFYLLTDEIYIVRRTFSIVSDEVTNETFEIPYADIKKMEITRERKTKKFGSASFLVKETLIHITYGDGLEFVSPIHDDITSDAYLEQIEKLANEYKQGVAEN